MALSLLLLLSVAFAGCGSNPGAPAAHAISPRCGKASWDHVETDVPFSVRLPNVPSGWFLQGIRVSCVDPAQRDAVVLTLRSRTYGSLLRISERRHRVTLKGAVMAGTIDEVPFDYTQHLGADGKTITDLTFTLDGTTYFMTGSGVSLAIIRQVAASLIQPAHP